MLINDRCEKTGKKRFLHKQGALDLIARKNSVRHQKTDSTHKRIKHRQGDFKINRVYYCSSCCGWHLSSMSKEQFMDGKEIPPPVEFWKYQFNPNFQKYLEQAA